jgi:hypothetical protein
MHAHDHHHDHDHDHPHGHDHTAAHHPHTEAVVLELGEELGALVVYTDRALLHREIEISPEGDDAARSHKDVLERVVAGRSLYAAVFDSVVSGTYTLWHENVPMTRGATVVGGAIAELDWTTAPAA